MKITIVEPFVKIPRTMLGKTMGGKTNPWTRRFGSDVKEGTLRPSKGFIGSGPGGWEGLGCMPGVSSVGEAASLGVVAGCRGSE